MDVLIYANSTFTTGIKLCCQGDLSCLNNQCISSIFNNKKYLSDLRGMNEKVLLKKTIGSNLNLGRSFGLCCRPFWGLIFVLLDSSFNNLVLCSVFCLFVLEKRYTFLSVLDTILYLEDNIGI